MRLQHESLSELRAAPELAHVTVLLVTADVLERALRVAHGPLDRQPPPHDAPTLVWAAEVALRLRSLRHALFRYRAAVLRVLRPPRLGHNDDIAF
jgi:hypothetical protein